MAGTDFNRVAVAPLELGGKDVEDLFTAVLSPAAAQPAALAPPPPPPAPPLMPVHSQGTSPGDVAECGLPCACVPGSLKQTRPWALGPVRTDRRKPSFVLMGKLSCPPSSRPHTHLPESPWSLCSAHGQGLLLAVSAVGAALRCLPCPPHARLSSPGCRVHISLASGHSRVHTCPVPVALLTGGGGDLFPLVGFLLSSGDELPHKFQVLAGPCS